MLKANKTVIRLGTPYHDTLIDKGPELWNGACSHIIPRFYRQQTAYKIWITHKRINWNYNLKGTLVGMDDEMALEFMKARFLF